MPITRITVETESLTIVRRASVSSGWCPQCRCDVTAAFTAETPETASRWATGAGVHAWNGSDGSTWLCIRSLARQLGAEVIEQLARPQNAAEPDRPPTAL